MANNMSNKAAQYVTLSGDKDINSYYRVFKCCKECLVKTRCLSYLAPYKPGNQYGKVVIHRPCQEWIEIRQTYIMVESLDQYTFRNIIWI